jgi:hypothetical protein
MTASILTVDDSPSIRVALKIALTNAGYSVAEAANGAEGRALPADFKGPSPIEAIRSAGLRRGVAPCTRRRLLPMAEIFPASAGTTQMGNSCFQANSAENRAPLRSGHSTTTRAAARATCNLLRLAKWPA